MVAVWFCGLRFVNVIFKNHEVSPAVIVVVTNATATTQRLYDSWNKTWADHKETRRQPYGTLTFVAATTSSLYGCRKGAVRPPQGCREATVWFSRHPRQWWKLYNTLRLSQGDCTVTLWCVCGGAALQFLKKSLMSSWKKPRKACDDLAAS